MAILKQSPLFTKICVMGGVAFALMIPTVLVQGVINEREATKNEAQNEVTSKWGHTQLVGGPLITVPYKVTTRTVVNGKDVYEDKIQYAHFLPDDLNIVADVKTEIRYRGIYEVPVYLADVKIRGAFKGLPLDKLHVSPESVRWNEATVSIAVSDLGGLQSADIRFQKQPLEATPGGLGERMGLTMAIPQFGPPKPGEEIPFTASIQLRGSEALNFLPDGKETHVELKTDWANPSFTGTTLPRTRNINANGTTAEWNTLAMARNYPQRWISLPNESPNTYYQTLGTRFLLPVDVHHMSTRAVKYAVLFIGLTFLLFFVFEILSGTQIHPMQYTLVGLALCLFYLLLVSLSEHFGFGAAYAVAGTGTVVLISLYGRSFLRSRVQQSVLGGVSAALYGFLYTLLQEQDSALMMGSVGLFAALATVMYVTRKIDWYQIAKSTTAPATGAATVVES